MDSKCSDLINLYNDLLLKKEGVCNSLNKYKLDKDNINWLRYKILEIRNIKKDINNIIDIHKEQKQESINAYKDVGIELPKNIFKNVTIPKLPEGIDEKDYILIFMDPSHNPREIFDGIRFDKHTSTSSSRENSEWMGYIKDENRATKSYAVWVQSSQQASKEFMVQGEFISSAVHQKIRKNNIEPITLVERLILELIYFKKTRKHMDDHDSYTLCAASYHESSNFFPTVCWVNNKLGVVLRKDDSYVDESLGYRPVFL